MVFIIIWDLLLFGTVLAMFIVLPCLGVFMVRPGFDIFLVVCGWVRLGCLYGRARLWYLYSWIVVGSVLGVYMVGPG